VGQVQATQPQFGQRIRILTGKGVFLPQTPHLAQAKTPGRSSSLPELPFSLLFSTARPSRSGEKLVLYKLVRAVVSRPLPKPDFVSHRNKSERKENMRQPQLERNRFAVGQKRNTGVSHGFIFRPWPFL